MTTWNVPALLDDFAPPLVITPAQVDRLVEATRGVLPARV